MTDKEGATPGLEEDVIAWNLIQTFALASSTDKLDEIPAAGIIQQSLEDAPDPAALVMALTGHGALLLRLYARAERKSLLDVLDEYGDTATLARLSVEMDEDDDE